MRPHRVIQLIFLRTAALAIFAGLALFLSSVPVARGQCGAEAKLLVSLIEPQKSVEALNATGESHGDVYLFDPQNLELFAQGVILRLRTGAGSDLTVKVRSREAKNLENTPGEAESFKCEIDIVGDVAFTSYSLRSMWKGGIPPEASEALYVALSAGQRRLLRGNFYRFASRQKDCTHQGNRLAGSQGSGSYEGHC